MRRAQNDQVARAQLLTGSTLIERTCSQFGEHKARGGPWPCPAIIWVADPESFADAAYFWNLRALRPLRIGSVPMLIIPAGEIQNWFGFADQVARVLARPDQFAPDVALCSSTLPESELHATAALLGMERFEGQPRSSFDQPAPTRTTPFSYSADLSPGSLLVFERSYGEITDVDVQLFRGKTNIRFASPVAFRAGGTCLARLSGAIFDGLPRRPAVAARVSEHATWHQGALQEDALQITSIAANEYRFELHIPELPEVTTAILSEAAFGHALSEKGKPGMAWLDRNDVGPLLEPGIFVAIRELTTPRSKGLLRELQKLRAEGAVDDQLVEIAAQWGGRQERRYRNADQLERVPRAGAPQVLERLCDAGWAERGLHLTCDLCGLPSFITFPRTSGQAICPGCGEPARYETREALTVYYRLNSYLDFLSDQGVLPHLLTIAALTRGGKASHFLPGVHVWFDTAGKDRAEADIFGVYDGQVFSGEVKTSASEFTDDQIERDVALSARLGVDKHVLAAADDIPASLIGKARDKCDAAGLELVVLQRADLLPGG